MMARVRFLILMLVLCFVQFASGQELDRSIESALPSLLETYRSLHAKPEISYYEEETASFMAKELRSLGFAVTERIGNYGVPNRTCYGVAAVLKNGTGPTVMV